MQSNSRRRRGSYKDQCSCGGKQTRRNSGVTGETNEATNCGSREQRQRTGRYTNIGDRKAKPSKQTEENKERNKHVVTKPNTQLQSRNRKQQWKQTNTANKLQCHGRHSKATTKGKQAFAASDSMRNTIRSHSAHKGAKMTRGAKLSALRTPGLRSHPLPTTQSPCSPAAPAGSPYHCSSSSGSSKRPKCLLQRGRCNVD